MLKVEPISRCSPGNECRLTVENATEIKSLKEDVTYMRDRIDKVFYGVAGSVILLLLNWLWQFLRK